MASKTKQIGNAKYVLRIPTHDTIGNLLHSSVAHGAYEHLHQRIPHLIHYTHVEGPHTGHKGTHYHVHIIARDQPETDSHIKQLATHVGDWVNHDHIMVTKEGQQGLQVWPIRNRHYDGGPARVEVMAVPSLPLGQLQPVHPNPVQV